MRIDYCRENAECIQNYELAKASNFKGWVIHHMLETHRWSKKEKRWVWRDKKEAIESTVLRALGLYYYRPAKELIYLTKGEHLSWHSRLYKHAATPSTWKKGNTPWNKGTIMPDEMKERIRQTMKENYKTNPIRGFVDHQWKKGGTPWNKGIPMSEEAKAKVSELLKGRRWYTNGTESLFYKPGEQPEGWKPGRHDKGTKKFYTNGIETRKYIEGEQPEGWYLGTANKGNHWYTNGIKDIQCKEGEQPEGWKPGRGNKTSAHIKAGWQRRTNAL